LSGKAPVHHSRATETALTWFAPGEARAQRAPYWIAPSRAATEWPGLTLPAVSEVVFLGPRLQLGTGARAEWDSVGNLVHAFLAADVAELDDEPRLACARRLLNHAALGTVLAPEALLRAGDSVRAWAGSRWPGATWRREVPVMAVLAAAGGSRRVEGIIDLLLETPDGVILIDHKSYPGARDTWEQKANEFAPQFAAYAEALRLAGKRVLEMWVTFCVAGGAVRLRERDAGMLQGAPDPGASS
jgi:RecB family exonuclease